jgi:probable F420-dependent oxidoreductase
VTLRLTYAPWGETLAEMVDAARAAEAAGAEVVWAPELHRSATVTAAALAAGTSTVGIGTAIALAFTRSPMVTALEAMDLDEMAQGRFTLGLGTGVQRLNEDWHNARWGKPVAHLRETVAIVREIVARCADGDPIVVEGEYEHARIKGYQRPYHRQRAAIPLYLAGMGPVMTAVAAEIGDGWISHELCSPAFVREQVLPSIATGLERAGKQRTDVDLVVSACCAVDTDGAAARRRAAGIVGFYASVRTYADFFAFHGFADDQVRVIDAFKSGEVTAQKLGDVVSDAMVDTLTIAGTPDNVAARLAAYDGVVDSVKLSPPTHGLDVEEIRASQTAVIALIADLSGKAGR